MRLEDMDRLLRMEAVIRELVDEAELLEAPDGWQYCVPARLIVSALDGEPLHRRRVKTW